MIRRLVLATRNPAKATELREILGASFDVACLPAHAPAIEETGVTFRENAELKALGACEVVG
ncbi:MAG: hypothetical protein N2322_06590, partial [Terrimicrobiaceae bacterium]|nr:hypothetical protein [Terrimicrobiaceae bacterium]